MANDILGNGSADLINREDVTKNNAKSSSQVNLEERSISDRKRQSMNLKEANNLINKPQRLLPDDLMEKYNKRTITLETVVGSSAHTKELIPSEEALNQVEEKLQNIDGSNTPILSKAKRLWKLAICQTIVGLRFISLYEELRAKGMNIQRAKALEAEGLSVLLSSANISKGDPTISAKVTHSNFINLKD